MSSDIGECPLGDTIAGFFKNHCVSSGKPQKMLPGTIVKNNIAPREADAPQSDLQETYEGMYFTPVVCPRHSLLQSL